MPLLSSQAGSSAKAFGLTSSLFSKVGNGYWINRTIITSENVFLGYEIGTDSSGNVYLAGPLNNPSNASWVAKYNSSGSIVWIRKIAISGKSVNYNSVTVDSSGNVYAVGAGFASFTGVTVVKYNSSGVLQFQKNMYNTVTDASGLGITVDSSGNIYICGAVFPAVSTANDAFVMKLDSSANIVWQRFLAGGSNTYQGAGNIVLDSSNNVYIIVYDLTTSPSTSTIVKYNSSGVLQWQRKMSSASSDVVMFGLAIDGSDNVYATGFLNSSPQIMIVAKYNSSGTVQWRLDVSYTQSIRGRTLKVDSSGNVYCISVLNDATSGWATYKFNTSGALQWAREVNFDNGGIALTIGLQGSSYYTVGNKFLDGYWQILLTNFPTDGSKTGVYNLGGKTVTYTPISPTVNTGTFLDSAGGLTDSAGNFNAPLNQSATDSAPGFTTIVLD